MWNHRHRRRRRWRKERGEVEEGENEQGPQPERKCNYQKVVVTEVVSCNHFWAQLADQGPHFEEMMKKLLSDLTVNPPLAGSFTPKKGSSCVGQFSMDSSTELQWRRL